MRRLWIVLALAVGWPATLPVTIAGNTTLYDDGLWRVEGYEDTGTLGPQIAVAVDGLPHGTFLELRAYRFYGTAYSEVYRIMADGALRPTVPAQGTTGGVFRLTGFWDCQDGARMNLRIASLDIRSNPTPRPWLRMRGALTDDKSLAARDLTLTLDLPDAATVRLAVRYSLIATRYICIDPWRQNTGEGFQVARMFTHHRAAGTPANDTARVLAYLDELCDCCRCWWRIGWLCAAFPEQTGYVFPYPAWMAGSQLRMVNSRWDPPRTPTLAIDVRRPHRRQCSAQGHLTATASASTNNVTLWVNWDFPRFDYAAGRRLGRFQFDLLAQLPGPERCELVVLEPQ